MLRRKSTFALEFAKDKGANSNNVRSTLFDRFCHSEERSRACPERTGIVRTLSFRGTKRRGIPLLSSTQQKDSSSLLFDFSWPLTCRNCHTCHSCHIRHTCHTCHGYSTGNINNIYNTDNFDMIDNFATSTTPPSSLRGVVLRFGEASPEPALSERREKPQSFIPRRPNSVIPRKRYSPWQKVSRKR